MEVSATTGGHPGQPKVAIEGCGHGTLHSIYASVAASCKLKGWTSVDLLFIGGDFQSVRHPSDLHCMSVPPKYRELGDFYEYYSGKRTAPYLTIFVGGNHEASNYLFELYYGGWAAPNIYFLGAANVLRLGGLRIAGLSGIWKGFDYRKPHHERLPYNESAVKSAYHVRELDVRKLLQIRTQVDIGLSHDWPKGIEWSGDSAWLFRRKNGFEDDARTGRLGSVAAKLVLDRLRPPYWFSAHLHIKYAAIVEHSKSTRKVNDGAETTNGNAALRSAPGTTMSVIHNEEEIDLDVEDSEPSRQQNVPHKNANEAEIDLGLDEDSPNTPSVGHLQASNGTSAVRGPESVPLDSEVSSGLRAQLPGSFSKPPPPVALPFPSAITNTRSQFLALDKCLPHRDFLQLIEIPSNNLRPDGEELRLEYDPEWLAITRALHLAHADPPYLTLGEANAQCPPDQGEAFYRPLVEEQETWVKQHVVDAGKLQVPLNFSEVGPSWDPETDGDWRNVTNQPREYANPQTQAFCDLLEIPNAFAITDEQALANQQRGPPLDENAFSGGARRGGGGRGRGDGRYRGRGGNRGFDRGRSRGGRW